MSKNSNKSIPVLRFPEFKSEWLEKPLVEWLDKIIDYRGKAPPKSEDGVILITARNVKQGFLDFTIKEFIPDEEYSQWMNRGLPKSGDVLFTTEAPLGNVCMFPNDGLYALGQRTLTLRVKKNNCGEFLFYLLQSPKNQSEIFDRSTGSTAKGIKSRIFQTIPFKFPELLEQEKIAIFLGAIATRLTQLRHKRDRLQTYKRGVMQKIFSQQVRFRGAISSPFPDWQKKKLGDITNIIGGGTPDTYQEEYWGGQIQWFTPTELKTKYVLKSVRTITELGLKKSSAKLLPKGTLLFSSRATVGDVSIALRECSTNQGFQSFIVNSRSIDEFLYNWIIQHKKLFLRRSSGSTFLEISKQEIQKIKILLPCIEEQEKIANFLTAIDQKIEAISRQIDYSEQFKKGLLQKMFV